MAMRFLTEPIGFLNVDYLLARADGFFGHGGPRHSVLVEVTWPTDLWTRIVEDAIARGMDPDQLVCRIVSEHYEREGICDNHEDELLH